MTNRKLHTHFLLVPKSTILDDLERPLRTLFQNTWVFGAHHKNMNVDPHYQRRKCRPITIIVSRQCKIVRIFAGFPGEGHQAKMGLSRTGIFRVFAGCIFENFRDKVSIMTRILSLLQAFHWFHNMWPWMQPFYVKFCFHVGTSSVGDCDVQKQLRKNKST